MNNAAKPLTSMQRQLMIAALIAAFIGLGYWWYTTLEWEEKEIDLGYSKEAKLNDFLAAEIFLRKHGVRATSVKNLSLLDQHSWRNLQLGQQDTIVLINGYKTLTWERYDALYDWVENGGTLITSTQNPFVGAHTDEEDVLLQDFNISLDPEKFDSDTRDFLEKLSDEVGDPEKDDAEGEEVGEDKRLSNSDKKKDKVDKKEDHPENYYRCSLEDEPTPITFGGQEKPLSFDFSRHAPFVYHEYGTDDDSTDNNSVDYAEPNEGNREHLVYFDIGEGAITITSDNTIWSNQRIDCHDHAYGLWRLINPDGRVWFLINQDAPSLASILWRNARYGVIAGFVALLLWLWAKSLRFGPVFTSEKTGRRSLAEHIYASAMLLWRKNEHPQLLDIMRNDILARMDEQHPNLAQATQEERAVFLQELTGIDATDIQKALFSLAVRNPQDFSQAIAHLQTIRKSLHGSNHF